MPRRKQKPKTRKKPMRRTARQVQRHEASRLIKDLVAVYVFTGSGSKPRVFNRTTFIEVPVTDEIDSALKSHPYRWRISTALLLREKNGKRKLISEEVSARDKNGIARIEYGNLAPQVVDSHVDLVSSYSNQDLIVTVGWVADPSGKELSPEDEMRLYEAAKAYENFIAAWELPAAEAAGQLVEKVA